MTTVQLSVPEALLCEHVASRRHSLNLYRRRPNAHGLGDPWKGRDEHALGAAGEYATSLALGLAWRAVVDDPWSLPGDVGRLQVRTRGPHGACLLLHRRDDAAAIFVAVAQVDPLTYDVLGWVHGADGMVPAFWGDPHRTGRPAFWVPADALQPLDTLRGVLAGTSRLELQP